MKYETILTGTDFSEVAERGVDAAAEAAKQLGAKRLHVVHVIDHAVLDPVFGENGPKLEARLREEALTELREKSRSLKGIAVTEQALVGIPGRSLSELADELPAQLMVVATHGRGGLGRLFLGSVANMVIRLAHCPIMVVGQDRAIDMKFQNILAAVDMSPASAEVLVHTLAIARKHNADVRVVSMFDHSLLQGTKADIERLGREREAELAAIIEGLGGASDRVHITALSKAPPSRAILEVAELIDADLIAVGTSGRNAWHRMIVGSTATRVLAEAKVPVLVVPYSAHRELGHELVGVSSL